MAITTERRAHPLLHGAGAGAVIGAGSAGIAAALRLGVKPAVTAAAVGASTAFVGLSASSASRGTVSELLGIGAIGGGVTGAGATMIAASRSGLPTGRSLLYTVAGGAAGAALGAALTLADRALI